MAERQDDPKRLRDLLPWLVNGTLDESERRRVEEYLQASASGRAEAAWLMQLKRDLAKTLEIPEGDFGHTRLMARIAAEREAPGKVAELPHRAARPRWMVPAFALAASVLLAQAVVIGVLVSERDSLQTLSAGPAVNGDLVQVTFKPTATEADIRTLLASQGAQIVSGPGALGVYTVRVAAGRGPGAVKALSENQNVVQSAVSIQR